MKRTKKKGKKKDSNKSILFIILILLTIPITILFSFNQQKYKGSAQTDANYPSTDGQILWDAGWETGDTSQWSIHAGGSWGNSNVQVVTSPVRWGKYAGELILNPVSGNVRAEISSSQSDTGGYAGQSWYYSTSVYFPSNPDKAVKWGDWSDFTQWMDMRANCSPPLQYDVHSDSTLSLDWELTTQSSGNCGYGTLPSNQYNMGPIVYDQWIDFTAHIMWSEDPNVGYVQVWRNGQEVVPLTHLQTLDSGSTGVYMEQAMYRPDPTEQTVIYIDGTRRHTAFVASSSTNPSTQPNAGATTPTPPFATPSFVCGGSGNGVCPSMNPTALPSVNPSGGNQPSTQPSTGVSINPSNTISLSPQPCQSNQSVTAIQQVAHHKKHKKGNNSNNSNLLSELLSIFQLLINLISKLFGGTPNTGTTLPSPC